MSHAEKVESFVRSGDLDRWAYYHHRRDFSVHDLQLIREILIDAEHAHLAQFVTNMFVLEMAVRWESLQSRPRQDVLRRINAYHCVYTGKDVDLSVPLEYRHMLCPFCRREVTYIPSIGSFDTHGTDGTICDGSEKNWHEAFSLWSLTLSQKVTP
jgi:hypothetical protein